MHSLGDSTRTKAGILVGEAVEDPSWGVSVRQVGKSGQDPEHSRRCGVRRALL